MPEEKIKRVVIAGATGYLGKYAVRAFKQQGYYVRVLTRSGAAPPYAVILKPCMQGKPTSEHSRGCVFW